MPPHPHPSRSRLAWTVVAIIFAASMLRSPIVAVAPIAQTIEHDLDITAAILGLFTSIPVLAFAVCTPLAVAVVRHAGAHVALTLSMAGAVLGCVIRSSGELPAAIVGTALLGIFLTIGNVVLPVIIARDFPPERVHVMTGVFTASLNVGTMAVTVATAPLADALGWRVALAASAAFGLAAITAWIALHGLRGAFRQEPAPTAATSGGSGRSVLRVGSTWVLGVAFAGQSFAFYSMTAWLPSLLMDRGLATAQAGLVAGVFQVAGIAGALLMPLITARGSALIGVICAAVAWLTVPFGFLLSPDMWLLWCLLGGLAQGGGLTVVFIMIAALGGGQSVVAGRSGIVQGIGYGVAATGPTIVGALHESTDGWLAPLLAVLLAILAFGVAGVQVAARLRTRAVLRRE